MQEKHISNFDEFFEWLQSDLPGIFRGHSDASWDLQSSIERYFSTISKESDYWITDEYYSIREFQRKAPLYTNHFPNLDDWISWIAMIQHHGGKTRLIDFTYSRYIAAYFAAIDAVSNFAIWDISDIWIRDLATNGINGDINCLREDGLKLQHDSANSFLSLIFKEHRGGNSTFNKIKHGIFMLEPTWATQRQSIQQGLFLMPKNIHNGFLQNLNGGLDKTEDTNIGCHIKKYVISYKLRDFILLTLKKMNLTAESLYGGLDGLARSLL